MQKVMLCSTLLLVAGGAAAPVAAQETASARTTCDARYYDDLVGKGMDELRSIQGSDYRVLRVGAARGAANPKRMTITVNPDSHQIVAVDCG